MNLDPVIFLSIIGLVAVLIFFGTVVAIIIILRRPDSGRSNTSGSGSNVIGNTEVSDLPLPPTQKTAEEGNPFGDQPMELAEFELGDMSTNFKGTTNEEQREGYIMHLTDGNTPLIAFSSQAFNPQNGAILAETVYGKMELTMAQGRVNLIWEEEPLGVLDYPRQRISGPEEQLLGSIERNVDGGICSIAFFGQKAADINLSINAMSTLRWLGGDESQPEPAFSNLRDELEDFQTLLLLAALLVEVGFFDLI